MTDKLTAVRNLIKPGSEMLTATVTTALALVEPAAGVPGAAAFIPVQKLLERVSTDLFDRITGYRARARAGAAVAHALVQINGRLEGGASLRTDGFFKLTELSSRSPGDEVLEGIILKARDAYEEKKVPLLGNIFVSGAFEENLMAPELNFLLGLGESLTYRQLCLLAIFRAREQFQLFEGNFAGTMIGPVAYSVVREVFDLARNNLIELRHDQEILGTEIVGMPDFTPALTALTIDGARLHDTMNLITIERTDLVEVARFLGHKNQ